MSRVKVQFSQLLILYGATNNEREAEVSSSTVKDLLDTLFKRYGERFESFLKRYMGRTIFIDVNGKSIYALGGLEARLKDGDVVHIIAPALGGG